MRSWNIGKCLHEDKLSLFNGVYRLSLCLLNSNSYDKSSIQVNLDWCTEPTGIKCNLQLRKGEQQTNEKIQGYYVNEHRMMRHLWSRSGKKKEGGGGLVVKAWVVSGCKRIDVHMQWKAYIEEIQSYCPWTEITL